MARQKRAIRAGRRVILPAPASQAEALHQVLNSAHSGPQWGRVFAVDGRRAQGSGLGKGRAYLPFSPFVTAFACGLSLALNAFLWCFRAVHCCFSDCETAVSLVD